MGRGWTFADLDGEQVAMVAELEHSLHADAVMVFRDGAPTWADVERLAEEGYVPGTLEATELERLQWLEQRLGAVAVAYKRTDPEPG